MPDMGTVAADSGSEVHYLSPADSDSDEDSDAGRRQLRIRSPRRRGRKKRKYTKRLPKESPEFKRPVVTRQDRRLQRAQVCCTPIHFSNASAYHLDRPRMRDLVIE